MNQKNKEFILFFLAATAILLMSSLPTWAGRAAQNDRVSFSGLYYDTPDYSVYIAMMQSGHQGDWLYQFRFTTEKIDPVAMRLFYILLGHISRWLHLQVETTFHLFRWLMGYVALYAIFLLCRRVFTNKSWLWSSFFLAALGSGLGWLLLLAGWSPGPITPIDFWLIDAYAFFSISLFLV
jgi:hypothetical protein